MNGALKMLHEATVASDLAQTKEERERAFVLMTTAHAALLKQLRNPRKPEPEWDKFPRGRDVFTQNDPWVKVR